MVNVPCSRPVAHTRSRPVLTSCDLPEDFVVPLELPVVESKPESTTFLLPAGDAAPPQEKLTPEEERRLDAVGWRMLNLPLIVCHSANGMPFFFPLQKVTL